MTAGRRGMAYMAGFALFWAVVEALAAGILRDYSPYQVVFTRYVVHMLLMLAVWGWRDPASLLRTRRPFFQLSRSMLMLVMPASWIMGMEHQVDGETLMTLFWLSPLLILGLAAIFQRERAPLAVWLGAAVAYVGALIFIHPHLEAPALRWIFPVGMAGSFSLYLVMTRSLRAETTQANLFYSAFGVAAALVPVMFLVWRTPTLHDLAFMVGVGVLGYGALFMLDHAASSAPVGPSATFAFLQLPLFVGIERGVGRAGFGRGAALGTAVILIAAGWLWAREPHLAVREAR